MQSICNRKYVANSFRQTTEKSPYFNLALAPHVRVNSHYRTFQEQVSISRHRSLTAPRRPQGESVLGSVRVKRLGVSRWIAVFVVYPASPARALIGVPACKRDWCRRTVRARVSVALDADDVAERDGRLDARVGNGFAGAAGSPARPRLGLGTSDSGHDYRLGDGLPWASSNAKPRRSCRCRRTPTKTCRQRLSAESGCGPR